MKWKKGTPDVPGVYVASIERHTGVRRYWNGARWSAPWYVGDPEEIIARARAVVAEAPEDIEWREVPMLSVAAA